MTVQQAVIYDDEDEGQAWWRPRHGVQWMVSPPLSGKSRGIVVVSPFSHRQPPLFFL